MLGQIFLRDGIVRYFVRILGVLYDIAVFWLNAVRKYSQLLNPYIYIHRIGFKHRKSNIPSHRLFTSKGKYLISSGVLGTVPNIFSCIIPYYNTVFSAI